MLKVSDIVNIPQTQPAQNLCEEYDDCVCCPLYKICIDCEECYDFVEQYDINSDTSVEELIKRFLEWKGFPQNLTNLIEIKG